MEIYKIHILIHRTGEDLKIDFDYDAQNDSIDQVVEELAERCQISDEEKAQIPNIIYQQILAQKRAASPPPEQHTSSIEPLLFDDEFSDSEDESIINDPEYQALLKKQKEELQKLEEKHQAERMDLTANAPQPSTTEDLIIFS